MRLLGDIQRDVERIRRLLEKTMAKKKLPKPSPEELAHRAETRRMLEERISYHEAKAREEEAARQTPKAT